jgi:hypothetical protein
MSAERVRNRYDWHRSDETTTARSELTALELIAQSTTVASPPSSSSIAAGCAGLTHVSRLIQDPRKQEADLMPPAAKPHTLTRIPEQDLCHRHAQQQRCRGSLPVQRKTRSEFA